MSDFSSEGEDSPADQINQLKEENELLTKKNATLESQIERMFDVCNSVEAVTNENTKNKAAIKDLTLKNEELQNRLDHTLKQNQELNDLLESEKKSHQQARNEDASSLNKEFERLADDYVKKINSLTNELQNLKSQQNTDIINRKVFNSKLDKLYQASKWHFNVEINSIEELTKLLQSSENKKQEEIVIAEPQDDTNLKILVATAKRYKSKAKAALRQLEQLSNELDDKDQIINTLNEKIQKQEDEHLNEIQQVRDENSLIVQSLQKKITLMENRWTQEKNEFSKFKQDTKMNLLSQRNLVPEEITKDNSPDAHKIITLEVELQGLKSQLNDKSNLVNKLTAAKDETVEKLSKAMADNNNLQSELEKTKLECDNLRILSESSKKECESLRSSLLSKQQTQQQPQIEKVVEKPVENKSKQQVSKRKYDDLSNKLKESEKLVESLNKRVLELEDISLKQRVELSSLKDKLETTEKRELNTKLDLQEAKDSISKLTQAAKQPESINWSFPDFDASLQNQIEQIGRQKELQNQSKLQNIYKVIQNYFKLKELSLVKQNQDAKEVFDRLRAFTNSLVIDFTLHLNGNPSTLEEFLDSKQKDELVIKLQNLIQNNESLVRDLKNMNEQMNTIKSVLNLPASSNFESISTQISQQQKDIEQMKSIASKSLDSKRQMKKAMNKALIAANEIKRESENTVRDINVFADDNQKKIDLLQRTVETLRTKLHDSEQNLEQKTHELEDEKDKNEKLQDDYDLAICDTENKVEQKCGEKIKEMENQVSKAESQAKSYKLQLETSQKLLSNADSNIKILERDLELHKKKLVDLSTTFEEKLQTQRNQLVAVNKSAIDDLEKQISDRHKDIEQLCQENSSIQKELNEMKQKYQAAKIELRKMSKSLKQSEEVSSREKRLCEVTLRAKLAAADSQFNERISLLTNSFNEEKMKILSFAAESFPQYFSGSTVFDERQYRSVVKQASDELSRLTESDSTIRRLLCASESQSTVDAVAQAIM
ncbi:hypothetical protein TVAG_441340 [Trichomonas vaginalis G3]|uniref:Uncharacterized protein n=1 Tax=Trichomonas vaginalis (strain ATCC PRA-98 / G3) TaxID=412133 RepID=A2FF90_TRIV3|nr:A-type inclusion protein-related family [Trichomonas vaginalis G3]EAX96420.1 hypothetical protein TVAG_441340 [Trichomonas vaginalis G3]KAI5501888.1 A-type inclusion protein-related family [Trichomonas vaginalis G3]|eukprot:XP_001309350.1 hypothetical protein [Trichomonas vaginalis G3]